MYNRRKFLKGAIIGSSLEITQQSVGADISQLEVEFPLPFAPFDKVGSGCDLTFHDYYNRLLIQNKRRSIEPGDIGLAIMDSRFEHTSACIFHYQKLSKKTMFNFLRMGKHAALPDRPEWIPLDSSVDPYKSACYLEFALNGLKQSFYHKIRDQLSKTMAIEATPHLCAPVNISFVMFTLGDESQAFEYAVYSGSIPVIQNGNMVKLTGSAAGLRKGWNELFWRTNYQQKADLQASLQRVIEQRGE